METEIWKSHPDIVGIEVSSLGNVRTLDRVVPRKNGTYHTKGRVLKQSNGSNGYLQVSVKVDGKLTSKRVNRLVAQTFLPNPNNLPQVNHRDCDKTNNKVENLEFCTASYNAKYRDKFGISNAELKGHPLFAINLDTLEVSHFRSQGEASRILGANRPHIHDVLKGKYKSTGGFWFVNDDENADDAINCKLQDIKKIYNNTSQLSVL